MQRHFREYDNTNKKEEKRRILLSIAKNYLNHYYDYSKPVEIQNLKVPKPKGKNSISNKSLFLQTKYFNLENTLKKAYKEETLGSLQKSLLNKIDFSKWSNKSFLSFLNTCNSIGELTTPSFMNKLVNFLKSIYKTNKVFSLNTSLLNGLTIDQLQELNSKIPQVQKDRNFMGKFFEKKFHYELDDWHADQFTLEDRRNQLIRMYDDSFNLPDSFKSALLLNILEYGCKLNIYDESYFILYLQKPLKIWHLNEDRYKKELYDHTWNSYLHTIQLRKGGVMSPNLEEQLYKGYLEHFYQKKDSIDIYKQFFDEQFFNTLVNEFDFLSGKPVDSENMENYEELENLVLINLSSSNKDSFTTEETVKIEADLKNVSSLEIKIYNQNAMNIQKEYVPYNLGDESDEPKAIIEKTINFDEVSPRKKFTHIFEFPELDKEKGLFEIKFLCDKLCSRAIIQRGSLSIISEQTVEGQISYIIDENRQILNSEDTGIYIQNQFFKADPSEEGKIIIPYNEETVSEKAIIFHENFSQVLEFTRYSENYSLDVSYIVPPESLIMANQATVIISPSLLINGQKWGIENLFKTTVTITTTSFSDKVPIIDTYENIKLSEDKDLKLKFTVPCNLDSVKIKFETWIQNKSLSKTEILTSEHKINLKTNNNQLTFFESHLRKAKGRYTFLVLGKNGEPIPKVDVLFSFTHSIYANITNRIQLTTDDEGSIELGPLDGIKAVNSTIYLVNAPVYGSWNLSYNCQQTTFPEKLEVVEGEDLEIPFITSMNESPFSQDTFSFMSQTSRGGYIKNLFNECEYTHPKNGSPGLIQISNLEVGFYQIHFKECDIKTNIIVHKGSYWKDESYILKENGLIHLNVRNSISYVKVRKIKHLEKSK